MGDAFDGHAIEAIKVASNPNRAERVELHAVHSRGPAWVARKPRTVSAWKRRIQYAVRLEPGKAGDVLTADLPEGACDQD